MNLPNRTLFHGDNLALMRGMDSECIDLIATDPPFNKGRDFHATPDSLVSGASFQDRWSWDDDVHQDWVDKIKDENHALMEVIEAANAAHSQGMGAFLCFLAVRMMECKRILKPTGFIYLQCDTTANSYIRNMMDAIFGAKNYRNEIAWCYDTSGRAKKWFNKKHDTIFCYARSNDAKYRMQRIDYTEEEVNDKSRFPKEDEGGPYYICGKGYKYYAKDGRNCHDWWADLPALHSNEIERKEVGYPTQKPLRLMSRIIHAGSDKGDWVFDPFAGCATTCVSAERLGRKWIGADLWPKTAEQTKKRLLREVDGFVDWVSTKMTWLNVITEPPKRTDDGKKAAPNLDTPILTLKAKEPSLSRAEMIEALLDRDGPQCQGCDFVPPHTRHFEIDHKLPRADGGTNGLDNRCLLCGPCNRTKGHTLTLSGLRRQNKRQGLMVK